MPIFRRPGESPGRILALWFVLLSGVQMSAAQADGDESAEYIEEITSVGKKSLTTYRLEMEAIEDVYFDLFNALNDDDEFDVICGKMRRTLSRLQHRTCRARFELEPLTEADRIRLENGMLPRINPPELRRKKAMLLKKMEKLAEENPRFREALMELARINLVFEAEKKARCSGRLICSDGTEPEDGESPRAEPSAGQ